MGFYSLFDNILAAVVAGMVLLLLTQVYAEGQATRVDVARYRDNRTRTVNFIEIMKQDFRNIGAGEFDTANMIQDWDRSSAPTRVFEFRGPVDEAGTVDVIRYEAESVSNETCSQADLDGDGVADGIDCYQVTRTDAGGNTLTVSPRTLTTFKIELRDASGNEVSTSNLGATRQVRVDVEGLFPMGERQAIQRQLWRGRLQPANLNL